VTVLTIGQLATYVGVTVRAVRHYHQRGLLAEPGRDGSGYRRYDADAVVNLIRIKTLSGAGVPLARIEELLNTETEQFSEAIAEIDEALTAKIRDLSDHRRRLAELDGGEKLFLPAEFVDYLDQLRALGVSARAIQLERNGWILLVAGAPRQATELLRRKSADLQDPELRELYLAYDQSFDWDPTDPRLEELATKVASFFEHRPERKSQVEPTPKSEQDQSAIAVALLSSDTGNSSPSWDRLTELSRDKLQAGRRGGE
jgi:DNA-binding transcriptional MerR regulator